MPARAAGGPTTVPQELPERVFHVSLRRLAISSAGAAVLVASLVLTGAAALTVSDNWMTVAWLLPSLAMVGLTLVLGAGVGIVVLALGVFAMGEPGPDGGQNVFLVASVCGFAAVLAGLWLVWQRAHAEGETAEGIG